MIDTATLPAVEDLLEEIRGKNHVRVQHFKAIEAPRARTIHRKVMDELSDTSTACLPMLSLYDTVRELNGQKAIFLPEFLHRVGGDLRSVTTNIRTTVGINFVAANLAGTNETASLGSSGQVAQADWIALSNNTVAVAAGDSSSTLPWSSNQAADAAAGTGTGEATYGGIARKAATMAHSAGITSYTASATWTASGAVTNVQKAGLFGGSSRTAFNANTAANILFLENTFTATTLALNDQLSLTWTVGI